MKWLKKKYKPKDGAIYAITNGNYKGQFVVFIENKNNVYGAIAFPEMEIHMIPEEDVRDGLKKGIIDYVEKLPIEIYALCKAEYNHRKNLDALSKEAKTGKEDDPIQDLIEKDSAAWARGDYESNN